MKNGEFKNSNGIVFEYGVYRDYEMKYYSTTIDGITVEFHGWNKPNDELRVLIDINNKRFAKDTKITNVDSITESQLREFIELAKQS